MKRPTWILLVILLVLVGLLIYLNREHNLDTVAESTPVDQVEFLFSDTDGLPTGISISANQGGTDVWPSRLQPFHHGMGSSL